ncbi:MAG: GNAT family N-acetyltransferase, partial [Bacteroidia bacterium]
MIVKRLDPSLEKQYTTFLLSDPLTLLYASANYRNFLESFLNEAAIYFVAVNDKGEIKGALPAFLKKNAANGNVLNSLPFYGSNGAVIEFENNEEVRMKLVAAFYDFAGKNNCVSTTLVSSPLQPMEDFYETATDYTLKDSRIGQLSPLPAAPDDIDAAVMKLIHYKMRNLVRKAQKLDIQVSEGDSKDYFDFLITTHHENLAAIGGIAKPEHFFRLIPEHFNYGTDYKIYVAKKDGQMIAAVLLFYFNKTVEYYTPVIKAEFRNTQALSLLIFEAMKEAV